MRLAKFQGRSSRNDPVRFAKRIERVEKHMRPQMRQQDLLDFHHSSKKGRRSRSIIIHLKRGNEGFLRDFDFAELPHLLLAFLLLF